MTPSHLRVEIDGKSLHELSEGAIPQQVEVRHALNEHVWCHIVCRQSEDSRFPFEDCLGKELWVRAIDEEGNTQNLFGGFVLESEMEYEIWGGFTARLTGVSLSYKLDLTPRQLYFRTGSLDEVAQQLVNLHELDFDSACEPRGDLIYHTQWGETDFQFLKKLADDHGAWLRADQNGVQIVNEFQNEKPLKWRAEDGLLKFKVKGKLRQPSMDGAHYEPQSMESKAFTEIKKEPEFLGASQPLVDAVKNQSAANLPPGYVCQRTRIPDLAAYEKLLEKESERAIGGAIEGYGVSRNASFYVGDKIKIEGVLDGNGLYGVTKLTHHWNGNGYWNEFWCTPWAKYTNPKPPKMKKWYGVVPGRVIDTKDPAKVGRVAVRFYWNPADQVTHWMRVMQPHAGADRGFYFIPEVGDEVVVAFEDGDIERPFVLGSVWNGVDKAPADDFWGGEFDNNDCKRIVTKSGHRIQLIDKEGKESIVIATPNQNRVAMLENSNENGRSSIMLHSDGDIFLSAGGRIHLKSSYYSREIG